MTLDQLKQEAYDLGLTDSDVSEYGNLRAKAAWKAAISNQRQLNEEAAEENRKASVARAYQSSAAPVLIPVAFGLAVGEVFIRNAKGMFSRK